MNKIYIEEENNIKKIAILEDDILVEYYSEEERRSLVGNIYRARVQKVLRGMKGAFVNIGEGKNGYLQLESIEDHLKEGQDILVQVQKDEKGDKGPKLTMDLSIPGRYLVLTPFSPKISISKKISKKHQVKRLREIFSQIKIENYGVVLRTNAVEANSSLLRAEYERLIAIYKKIEEQRNFLPIPKLVYKDLDTSHKIIRDLSSKNDYQIIVNRDKTYKDIVLIEDYFEYKIGDRISLNKTLKVDDLPQVRLGLKSALAREVKLKSGAYLVIDKTEALTVIDVNSGKNVGDFSYEDTIKKINLEATYEIARQIRLRNISGIIIIDFIDMKDQEDLSLVLENLGSLFKLDRNSGNIIDVTKLNLVEITRKKLGHSLDEALGRILK